MKAKSYLHYEKDGFEISTDPVRLDKALIHHFLSEHSYWAAGVTREDIESSMEDSICYGVYCGERQVGFASVETDYASFAYLTDIFVLEEFRGRGLSQWLLEVIISHPGLQKLDSWMLVTDGAQGLYEKFGFKSIEGSPGHMERRNHKR